jgi:hypothetical protein
MLNYIISFFKLKYLSLTKKKEGIVTLADSNYFQGLIVLYYSVQQSYEVPMICYDIGLTEEQKKWIKINLKNLTISDIPDFKIIKVIKEYKISSKLRKKGKRQWPLWICPFLIKSSPFERVLWLDCDVVVLRNLAGLFNLVKKAPVFTPENFAPHVTANKDKLYDLLPIGRLYNPKDVLINAGVSGWDLMRDKEVLDYYGYAVKRAFEDEDIMDAISWHDQGALIWAIYKSGLEKNIVKTWKWNLCVKNTKIANNKYEWGITVIDKLKEDVLEANLIHWNGHKVPWSK